MIGQILLTIAGLMIFIILLIPFIISMRDIIRTKDWLDLFYLNLIFIMILSAVGSILYTLGI